jgi:hypothetical protein
VTDSTGSGERPNPLSQEINTVNPGTITLRMKPKPGLYRMEDFEHDLAQFFPVEDEKSE